MSNSPGPLGFGSFGPYHPSLRGSAADHVQVIVRRPLHRILAFIGRSIDDVVNNPIVKNQVFGYYKLHKQINRTCEVVDLERQWNPPAARKGKDRSAKGRAN